MKKIFKRIGAPLAATTLVVSFFGVLFPQTTSAAPEGSYIDKATIIINDGLAPDNPYYDTYPFDSDRSYKSFARPSDDCAYELKNFRSDNTVATLYKNKVNSVKECVPDGEETVNLTNTAVKDVTAYQIDKETVFLPFYFVKTGLSPIATSDIDRRNFGNFKRLPSDASNYKASQFFLVTDGSLKPLDSQSGGNCKGQPQSNPYDCGGTRVDNTRKVLESQYCNDSLRSLGKECRTSGVSLAFAQNGAITQPDPRAGYSVINPGGGGATGSGSGNIGGDAATDDSCEAQGSLSWMICPIIDLLDGGISALDNQISNLLDVQRDPKDSARLMAAEQRIRNFAYIILIPVMLVMVISTALGFEFISAYTVKKALPRLLVATIFIALSSQITTLLIDVTNALGAGISGLLLQPFIGTSDISLASLLSTTAGAGISGVALFGAAIAAYTLSGALVGIILSYAFVTFVVLFIAFAILAVRQVLIIVLALLAPLAILAWIFPGNDKLWRLWWGSFSKLLLMYPLIMLLITSGKVFASFVSVGEEPGILATLLTVTAYIAPYFFIPATFKFAGAAFSTIAGMANNRSKGLFDRQKNFRGNLAKQRHEQNMQGQTGVGTGRSGRLYRRIANPQQGFSPTRSGRAKFRSNEQIIANKAAAAMMEQDGNRSLGDDDASALAVKEGMTASKFIDQYVEKTGSSRDVARDALAALETNTGARIGSSSMRVAAFKARSASSTAYDGSAAGTAQRINEGASLIRDGLLSASDATAAAKGNRARTDISGNGFANQMKAFSAASSNAEGMTADQANAYLHETLQSADPGDMLAGNTRTVEAMAPIMMENLNSAISERDLAVARGDNEQTILYKQQAVDRSLGQIAGIQDNLNRTSPQKAGMFADIVNGAVLPESMGGQTVRAAIDEATRRKPGPNGIQTFLEVRKEYGSVSEARGAGATEAPPEAEH